MNADVSNGLEWDWYWHYKQRTVSEMVIFPIEHHPERTLNGEVDKTEPMTAYRLRFRPDDDSTDDWWELRIGKSRTLVDLHKVINEAVGLSDIHLWFFGEDRKYFESPEKYESPIERAIKEGTIFEIIEKHLGSRSGRQDASTTLIGDLELSIGDEFCYLYDYLQRHYFYLTLEAVEVALPDQYPPKVMDQSNHVNP